MQRINMNSNNEEEQDEEESPSTSLQHQQEEKSSPQTPSFSLLSDDTESVDDNDNEDAETTSSLDQMCMSPPQTRVETKIRKRKQRSKRLLHSTMMMMTMIASESGDNLSSGADDTTKQQHALIDSLADLQVPDTTSTTTTTKTSTARNSRRSSVAATASSSTQSSLTSNRTSFNSCLNNAISNIQSTKPTIQQTQQATKSTTTYRSKSHAEIDPFDRDESFKKISILLKLALSNKQECPAPPSSPIPPPTTGSSSLSSTTAAATNEMPFIFSKQPSTISSSGASHYSTTTTTTTTTSSSPLSASNKYQQPDDLAKKTIANNVWKHMFDYFVFFNERATSDEQIEQRLHEKRSIIPATIRDITDTNFTAITQHMNTLIRTHMRTPSDYSRLYEHKVYIDQLCYLYWLVEDVLNRVGYIESLYPSLRLLRKSQPTYADPNFDGTVKTLLLWYKIMTDLMNKCDVLGKFLGFAKRAESLQYWTWFDQRLKYSRTEYEVVQKWLNNMNLATTSSSASSSSTSLLLNNNNNIPKRQTSQEPTTIAEGNDQFALNADKVNIKHSPTKQNRQVSFELKASRSSCNLIYNNNNNNSSDISPSIMQQQALHQHVGGMDTGDIYGNDTNPFTSQMAAAASSSSSHKSKTPPILTVEALASHLFSTNTDNENSIINGDNDHLKPVKWHHLQSYISRSSSFMNNESPNAATPNTSNNNNNNTTNYNNSLSSSFYSSLNEISDNSSKVNFNLNADESTEESTLVEATGPTPMPRDYTTTPTAFANEEAAAAAAILEGSRKQSNASSSIESATTFNREKIYVEFLHKRLRKHGLTKTCDEIRKVILDALPHALQALQIDHCERVPINATTTTTPNGATTTTSQHHAAQHHEQHFYYHLMPLHRKCREYMSQFPCDEETLNYGVSSSWFKRLDLPTFRPLYLYLSNVILDLMHTCIRMQISSKRGMKEQSNFKFSLLSIEVLTHECRECIEQAILVRQFYYHMVFSVFVSSEMDVQSALENDLLKFDDDLKKIIDIYLTFITDWVHDLVANTSSVKALDVLNEEWKFCKNNLYFVTASEDMYAKRFCTMCSLVNDSLLHSLSDIDTKHKQPLMDYISNEETMLYDNYYDSINSDDNNTTDNTVNNDQQQQQLQRHSSSSNNEEEDDDENGGDDEYEEEEAEKEEEEMADEHNHGHHHRYSFDHEIKFDVNLKCNEFKEEINQLRKRSMKALGFCSSLIGDLELAAKYTVTQSLQKLLGDLKDSRHVLVSFINPELQMNNSSSFQPTPNSSSSSFGGTGTGIGGFGSGSMPKTPPLPKEIPSFMIFVPYEFSKDKTQIVRLLFLISAKDDMELNNNNNNSGNNTISGSNNNHNNNNNHNRFPFGSAAVPSSMQQRVHGGVRRLSSSNSFIELNDTTRDTFLSRLNKIANLNSHLVTGGSEATSPTITTTAMPNAFIFAPLPYTDGYLLYIQLPKSSLDLNWTGPTISLYASMPVRRSLYQHKSNADPAAPASLILVVPRPSILADMRVELKKKLKGTITLVKEKTSFHPNIEYAIDELKDNILVLRDETVRCIQSIEKDLKTSVQYSGEYEQDLMSVAPPSFQQKHSIEQRYLSEIWRVSYNFGIELQNECVKFMTQDRAELYSRGLAEFCIMWCGYIVDKTERGKGRTVRPWAAKKGIQLMNLAWQNSRSLKDTEFTELKTAVENCLLHVIGDRSTQQHPHHHHHYYHNNQSPNINVPSAATTATMSSAGLHVESLSLKSSFSMFLNPHHHHLVHQLSVPHMSVTTLMSQCSGNATCKNKCCKVPPSKRFSQACRHEDKRREKVLLEKRYIGKILDQQRAQNVINATEVNFRWQLGLLVGQGQYGKVYSCVNLDTGEPMAMKEIPFKSNDVETIKGLADEINNVQGIQHENLVKFYGAELHRKEMLIFMEFCGDQSTLDRISREASGLPEKIVRDYTKSLLRAVETLHENKIMHRDIKGANIFLKVIDPKHPDRIVLKLGDFGCSIKFKDPIGAGSKNVKATGFMGTFAFMAPEVMVSGGALDAGYTYVADIWSLGCVVIEMFTGKRPWHPLNDQNIMYIVHIEGKQKKPPYPTNPISEEAIDFLNHCLEYEPSLRYTADQLLDHPFVKVELNDDK